MFSGVLKFKSFVKSYSTSISSALSSNSFNWSLTHRSNNPISLEIKLYRAFRLKIHSTSSPINKQGSKFEVYFPRTRTQTKHKNLSSQPYNNHRHHHLHHFGWLRRVKCYKSWTLETMFTLQQQNMRGLNVIIPRSESQNSQKRRRR